MNKTSVMNSRIYMFFMVSFLLVSNSAFGRYSRDKSPPKSNLTISKFEQRKKVLFFENSGQFADFFSPDSIFDELSVSEDESTIPLIEIINQTNKTLNIEVYETLNLRVQDAILKALRRGVVVSLLVEPDPVGNGCDAFSRFGESNKNCKDSETFTSNFKKAASDNGSVIRYFNKKLCVNAKEPLKGAYCYQHGKMLIKDSELMFLSTGNFNSSSLCADDHREDNSCNRDYSILVKDLQVVKAGEEVFRLDLEAASTCDLPPKNERTGGVIRKFTEGRCKESEKEVDPIKHRNKIAAILNKYKVQKTFTVSPVNSTEITELIDKAKKTIYLQAQYLRDPTWHEKLLNAQKRGVKIYASIASLCHFSRSSDVGHLKYRDYFEKSGYVQKWLQPLTKDQKNPVEFRFINQSTPRPDQEALSYLHSKVFLIDEKTAWVGSNNGSFGSNHINREFGLIINDQENISKIDYILKQDFSQGMTLKEHVPFPHDLEKPLEDFPRGSCKVYKPRKS